MKAMTATAPHQVAITDVAEPVAADHEALVEVAAYSVNRGETFLLAAPPAGWRPGKDLAGTVVAAAADGSGPPAGARVVGHARDSAWAERVAVSTAALAEVPDAISLTTAAALPLAGLTALRLMRRAGSLIGRRLLLTGASGGVGHYVVELATGAGAHVTAVSATVDRGARLREYGATTVTSVHDAMGWFDVTMESVGGDSFVEARRRTHPTGTVIWFGQASLKPVTFDFFDWIGGTVGAPIEPFSYEISSHTNGEDLATLLRLISDDRLHPEIGALLPWQDTQLVIEDLRARKLRGNAVLQVIS
ncbi:zinc-binding dehydrogenase [Rhodococcus sp. G-MC3]|uniref:zinc-binding dehydrogenase n=1 Tax=Rhodococcus sp. G-MC3 TaxID=3046209 RepID=UPI0024BA03DC|nr:zinc-binding dehydrogenase [Rhodococcus sp. G-MC3]MDJ0396475.1 zinc-binding dehydrogenase [Rhodococcus sp. G-MC3]